MVVDDVERRGVCATNIREGSGSTTHHCKIVVHVYSYLLDV